MQTIFILVNTAGILLGVYRERKLADQAIKHYNKEDAVIGEPRLYLYKVSSDELNKFAKNRFDCVWMSDPRRL